MRQARLRTRSRKLLTAAVASVAAVAAVATAPGTPAWGGLMIDLRVVSANGSGNTIAPGGKSVGIGALGNTVTIGVYARVSGTNSVQTVTDVNGNGSLLVTHNDDSFKTIVGSFQSVGALKGNMGQNTAGPLTVYNSTFPPFNGSGSTNGALADFDSDGDLDLGSPGTDPTSMWDAHPATEITGAVASDGTHGYLALPNTYVPQSQDTIIDATTNELRVGTLRFVASAGSASDSTSLNFIIRANGDSAALWFEDNSATGKNPTNSPFSLGAPVVISLIGSPPGQTVQWSPQGGSTAWNLSASNWSPGSGQTTFANGDPVVFGNSGVGAVTVDAGGVSPGGVTFTHSSGTYTFSGGSIGGTGGLVMTGAGSVVLSATNGYSGGTTIGGGGTLIVDGGDDRLGAAGGAITFNNGTLQTTTTGMVSARNITLAGSSGGTFDSNGLDSTLSGVISGSGAFTKRGAGTLILTAANTFTGGTTIQSGTLQIGNGGASGSLPGNVADSGTLIFDRSDNVTFGGTISAGGTVVQAGTGTLDLTASNSYATTTVLSGTLRVASDGNLGTATGELDLRSGSTLKLDGSIAMARTVLLGDAASSNVTLDATGQTLSFTGTGGTGITGPIVLSGGTLNFNRSGGLIGVGAAASITVNSGATLNLSGKGVFYDGVNRVDVINNSATSGFNVTGGSHEMGALDGSGNTSVSAGATLTATHIRQGNLTVSGTAAIHANSLASGVSRVVNLSIPAGGRLDLADNKLIVAVTPTGTWNGSAYTDLTGLVASGRNGNATPFWDGSGIVTSQPPAPNANYTAIGVARASDVLPSTASATALWAGQTVTGTDTLIMYTYGGDANLDGKINVDDYIRTDLGRDTHLTGWSNGDFNYDGKVNIDDYTQFIDANIGIQGAPFSTASSLIAGSGSSGATAVPEPAGALVMFCAALMMRRVRRRGA